MGAGGCNAMRDENMNQEKLIPQSCHHCGQEAMTSFMGNMHDSHTIRQIEFKTSFFSSLRKKIT